MKRFVLQSLFGSVLCFISMACLWSSPHRSKASESVTQSKVDSTENSQAIADVPKQFAGLLTDSTDYTCGGLATCSTWPYPAIPKPGSAYADPSWHTTSYRLVPPQDGGSGSMGPFYNRVPSWNSTNTLMFVSDGVYTDLYDATKTPPAPIARIDTTDGCIVDGGDNDAIWANTDPNRIYYAGGVNSCGSGALQLRYVDVSKCTRRNCKLTPHVVHTFSCKSDEKSNPELGAGVEGNKIETGSGAQGGMFDATDTFFTFTCDKVDGKGRHEIDFIRYDRQSDTVTTQTKWYNLAPESNPANNAAFVKMGNKAVNIIRMSQHPNGKDITVIWQCGTYDEKWTRGCGTEDYDPTYKFKGVISGYISHQDLGYDVNGKPVWVAVGANSLYHNSNSRGAVDDPLVIEINDLTQVSPTLPPSGIPAGKIHAELPCAYAYSQGSGLVGGANCYKGSRLGTKAGTPHLSMTGTWGALKGYALFSTLTNYGANAPYAAQDEPAATTLTSAITTAGVQTFTVASAASIGVGTGITIGVPKHPDPDFCSVTAVKGNSVTCDVAHPHKEGEPVQNLTAGDTGFGAFEMLVLKIDASQKDWAPLPAFYRVGRTMSVRDADYNAEPHATVNRDFTQILWGSNWNVDGGKVYAFWMKLP